MDAPHYTAKLLSPILPVADLDRAVAFYTAVLGFGLVLGSIEYAVLRRDAASLHLTKAAPDVPCGHTPIYLEVDDLQALWSHVSQFRGRYALRDPFDREYGMREFHVVDPDGCLVFVGQPINAVTMRR